MKQTITKSAFRDAFRDCGRADAWTYDGLGVLFDYLDSGEDEELDVIALDGIYAECTIAEILNDYDIDTDFCEDEDDEREAVREYLEYNTFICGETSDGFVFCTDF